MQVVRVTVESGIKKTHWNTELQSIAMFGRDNNGNSCSVLMDRPLEE